MKNVSIVTFRVDIPAGAPAGAPVVTHLSGICPAMVELQMWCSSQPVIEASGWRMLTRDGQVIPDNGSDEAGIVLGEHEAGWAPLPGVAGMRLALADKILSGPAYDLELQFWSTAALTIGGILVTRDPQHTLHDLIVEMKSWQEKLHARTDNGPT